MFTRSFRHTGKTNKTNTHTSFYCFIPCTCCTCHSEQFGTISLNSTEAGNIWNILNWPIFTLLQSHRLIQHFRALWRVENSYLSLVLLHYRINVVCWRAAFYLCCSVPGCSSIDRGTLCSNCDRGMHCVRTRSALGVIMWKPSVQGFSSGERGTRCINDNRGTQCARTRKILSRSQYVKTRIQHGHRWHGRKFGKLYSNFHWRDSATFVRNCNLSCLYCTPKHVV